MNEATTNADALPLPSHQDVLTDVLGHGATQLLAQAIQAEVAAYLEERSELCDEHRRRQVVRNGSLPQRTILTGIGPVEVKQPRVQDRRPPQQREKFSSAILPPYLRKTKSIEELISWLYLKGVSTANVLDKLPKGQQPKAKAMLPALWQAATKAEAEKAFALFVATWQAKYSKATDCLVKDREALLVFDDFPAEHWVHVRTTNPIASTFATVRLRTSKTKGSGSRLACLTMVFKRMESAAKKWRLLNGSLLLRKVITGLRFVDGVEQTNAA